MPLTDPTPPNRNAANRRSARTVLAVGAVLVALIAVVAALARPREEVAQVDREALEVESTDTTVDDGTRNSVGLDDDAPETTAPAAPEARTEADGDSPGDRRGSGGADRTGALESGRSGDGSDRRDAARSAGGSGRATPGLPLPGGPTGSGDTAAGPPSGGVPPFYIPGTGSGPVVGPVQPDDDVDEPTDPDVDPHVEPAPDPEPFEEPPAEDPPVIEEPPDLDEAGCPNLDLYPIGGYAESAPQSFVDLSPRFREQAPALWAEPELVCGHALEPWRDLVVQRLVAAGTPVGTLITAADGSSVVMRLSEVEWTTYRFRYGGGPFGPNLLGYPVQRYTWGSAGIIRTTGGAFVFARSDSMGIPLVGGAWDLWVASGGPEGVMGMPLGLPESATGPIGADAWTPGLPSTGARQDFTNGWIFLPGVLTDVEAAAQPADRYEWHPHSDREQPPEVDFRGHVMQLDGMSFYVDMEGSRHWIPTQSAWSCAVHDLGATEHAVTAAQLARYPIGPTFVCTDFKD